MPKRKKWVGNVFGRLTIISESFRLDGRHYYVECLCICGKQITERVDRLSKHSSCGCLLHEEKVVRGRKLLTKHGLSGTHEHRAWLSIISRCRYNDPCYIGIEISDEWKGTEGFLKFLDHIGKAPSESHTVDRIDNSIGYFPGNVRWATPKEQSRNKTCNCLITALNKTQCISAWEEETGIKRATIAARLTRGWDPDKAVSMPVNRPIPTDKSNQHKKDCAHRPSASMEWKHWYQMVRRCTDVKSVGYKNYGGSGITITTEWLGDNGFSNFLKSVGFAPSPNHTLDRINTNLGYVVGNVRWATKLEQAQNRKNNVLITAFGKTQCISAWARELDIKSGTISKRLKRGLSSEDALKKVKK